VVSKGASEGRLKKLIQKLCKRLTRIETGIDRIRAIRAMGLIEGGGGGAALAMVLCSERGGKRKQKSVAAGRIGVKISKN